MNYDRSGKDPFVKLFFAVWILGAILSVSILGLVVYVILHFLSKIW